jgi:hypothetical protein
VPSGSYRSFNLIRYVSGHVGHEVRQLFHDFGESFRGGWNYPHQSKQNLRRHCLGEAKEGHSVFKLFIVCLSIAVLVVIGP